MDASPAFTAEAAVTAPMTARDRELLSAEALQFIVALQRRFNPRRLALLEQRGDRQRALDAGEPLQFLPATGDVRDGDWQVAPPPADLVDRRVEITGPVERKMIINALNSGASAFMADFEDSTSPTWRNIMDGQANLYDTARREIEFIDPRSERHYTLNDDIATLLVRPRGWHLSEKHITIDGAPISASLFDFGLHFFHNARRLIDDGSGPYFYLPKLESHLEARLWNDVFVYAQQRLGIARGTIRAAVLIETINAVFEMHEILYELREHSAGLNCGRWDYIFSFIKRHRLRADSVLPDRATITMDRPFLAAYSGLLIQTCHRRGTHAMGGMAAQIPIRRDAEANEIAMKRFRADKTREVLSGHDGSWVAHPGLVAPAFEIYAEHVEGVNQLDRPCDSTLVSALDLLEVPDGDITLAGVQGNLSVGLDYLAAWLTGRGCVPINNLMEDTATAEICRAQLWQWLHHGAVTVEGHAIDAALYDQHLEHLTAGLKQQHGAEQYEASGYPTAARLFSKMIKAEKLDEFLTIPAYRYL
jgi:malate synthase